MARSALSDTTALSVHVPTHKRQRKEDALEGLDQHHHLVLLHGGNVASDFLHNTHSLASGDGGECVTNGILSRHLMGIARIASAYGAEIRGGHGRSNHLDLNVFTAELLQLGDLHPTRLARGRAIDTSVRWWGFHTSGKQRN